METGEYRIIKNHSSSILSRVFTSIRVLARALIPRLHDTTGCQTGLYNRFDNRLYTRYNRLSNGFGNRFDNRLYRVYKHLHDTTCCQTCLTTGMTTGCIV